MKTDRGRQEIIGYSGLVIPFSLIEPYVIRIQKARIDERALENRQRYGG